MNYDGEVSIRYEKGTMEDADKFFSAVADGDYETMVKMLDEGRSDVNQTDSDGFSALMISASEGYEKIVEELLKRGCNVNSVTLNKNNTPLFFAAKGGNVKIGKMILAKNKKLINQCNILGETPLLWACYSGQYDFFMFLLSQKAEIRAMSANDTTCLIGACLGQEPSRLKIVKHILKLVPKIIDVQDVDGQSALHVAASIGNYEIVKYLIEAGADNTLRDVQGFTPLQIAEKACYSDCVEILEAKWKELEAAAREEMEEFLRAEGYTDDLNEKQDKKKKNRKGKGKQEINRIHPDYQCDNCKNKKRIQGIRYSCKECDDYDLCEECFSHAWDVHPHTHFVAFEPPQPDVFGILKEGPGKEVLAPTKPVEKTEEVKEEEKKTEEVKTEEVKTEEVKTEVKTEEAKTEEVKTEEVKKAKKEEVKKNEEDDWTVIPDRKKKGRSLSTSVANDDKTKKKTSNKNGKMNYKKAIQKSLNSKKEQIPTVPTGGSSIEKEAAEPAMKEKTSHEDNPVESTSENVEKEPTGQLNQQPTQSTQPTQPSIQLPSLPDPILPPSEPLPHPSSPQERHPSLSLNSNQPFSSQYPYFQSYQSEYNYNDNLPFSTHPSIDGFDNYDYYDYNTNSIYYQQNQLWPKTHYGLWREKEMDNEREQWLFDEPAPFPAYPDENSYNYSTNPSYTSEELQKILEMSNPSARAMCITVPQYLGLDLDYATDKQLTMLMDMHMEAIKQITAMRIRLAKTNERQRLLYPRETMDHPDNPQNYNSSNVA